MKDCIIVICPVLTTCISCITGITTMLHTYTQDSIFVCVYVATEINTSNFLTVKLVLNPFVCTPGIYTSPCSV